MKVGVFEYPRARSMGFLAYVSMLSPGLCIHDIEASNGAEAKKLAIAEHRKQHVKCGSCCAHGEWPPFTEHCQKQRHQRIPIAALRP